MREQFKKRMEEFTNYIINKSRMMPKVWQVRFTDGGDMRLWFDKLKNIDQFTNSELMDAYKQIMDNISSVGIHILNDESRELEFLNYVEKFQRIPMYGDAFFSDNADMNSWYLSYKNDHDLFETEVHNKLPEYQNFHLEEIIFDRDEFVNIMKKLKRVPNHGEFKTASGIDVRTIFDKLEDYNPDLRERILLHLETYNKHSLTIDNRVNELITWVSEMGYVPYIGEARFSDGTDMFTWFNRYKKIIPFLENDIQVKIDIYNQPNNNCNIYFIPMPRKNGGDFYVVCQNVGERLDLSGLSLEEAQIKYPDLDRIGGMMVKKGTDLDDITGGKKKQ